MGTITQGRIIGGKFRLDQLIAGGGMGSIWQGWDMHLDAPVAVKFMRKELAEDEPHRARFEREAKAAAKIRSPHVVHIYDHGVDAGTPFIVMELLEGEDLGQRLKRLRQLPVNEVVRICTEICRGLHRAHRRDIVHRDLKPGNVFLSAPDDDLVKLLDFGIAKAHDVKAIGSEATTTGQLLGSPHYMSPEQARGLALDGRADLWSLTVILYRALTGHHPFRGVDIGDLIVRICMDVVPVPSSYRPGLEQGVDEFFDRAFMKPPGQRIQTAKEFAAAFSEAARQSAAAAIDSGALSESSWDSTGGSRVPEIAGSASDSHADEPVPAPRLQPASELPPLDAAGPTPTGPSGTLGSILAEHRPPRRWNLWAAGAAAIALLGAIAFVAVSSSSGESAADSASSAAAATTATDPAEPTSPTAARDLTPLSSASETSTAADGGAAGAETSSTPSTTGTARPPTTPRRPRPTTVRPKPKPTTGKRSGGYQPSELGY